MANIPVERTSAGTPWWLWLIGLFLLGLLLWFLIGVLASDEEVVADNVEMTDPAAPADPSGVSTAGTMDPVAVAALDLSNLYVTRVVGDRTFFVAPNADMTDQEALVLLDQSTSQAPGVEGQVDINPGQRIALTGGVMEPLGDMDLSGMGVPPADRQRLTADSEVIRVDGGEVRITSADMDNVEAGE